MAITVIATLEKIECARCCAIFAISSEFIAARRLDHAEFTCPYCRSVNYYPHETPIEAAERRRKQAEQSLVAERQRHDQTRAALADAQIAVSVERTKQVKLKKRIAAGMCPCCKRPFANLMRHMQHKHPKFEAEQA